MKIGIIAVGYQSEYIINSLAPWIYLKNGSFNDNTGEITKIEGIDIKICTCSALFKERYDMGERYANDENETYLKALEATRGIDKCIFIKDHPIIDFESRNYCWDYLKQFDLDLIWQLDFGDEIYSVEQILATIEFIKKNKYCDWYKVNFKNFVFDYSHYVDDFCPPRITWVKKNGGVDKFVWDNDLVFKNGLHSNQCSSQIIPKKICFPKHYSWCGSPSYLKMKVAYQQRCLGTCSFRWNSESNKLEFNPDYYKNVQKPIVYDERA